MKLNIRCESAANLPLDQLINFQKNLKDLSKENYERLRDTMLQNGFISPFHIWVKDEEYNILDGHQRLRCLKNMREEGIEIPDDYPITWVQADNLEQAKNNVLSLSSVFGTMTDQGLYEFFSDYTSDPAYIREILAMNSLPNIDADQFIENFFDVERVAPGCDEDEIPELKESISKIGDMWRIAGQTVICGDSTNIQHIERLMGGQKVDMVFTDPPYGVSYEKKCEEIFGQTDRKRTITNDDLSLDDLKTIIQSAFHNIEAVLADKSCYYVCSPQGGELGLMMMMMMMQEANLMCRHMIIWVKNAPVFSMGRLDYDYQHEPILFGWSKNRTHHKSTLKGQWKSSVWSQAREQNKLHPTMKPVNLIENAIMNSCPESGNVLDVFGGSGSTLVACAKTGRKGFACEIDPQYVDVIVKRLEEFSGEKAELLPPE